MSKVTDKFTQLRYPYKRIETNSSYLRLSILEKTNTPLQSEFIPSASKSGSGDTNRGGAGSDVFGNFSARTKGSVLLPMPLGIKDSNSVTWSDSQLNALEQVASSKLMNVMNTEFDSDFFGNIGGQLESTARDAANALRNSSISDSIVKGITANILQSFGSNASSQSLLSRTTGQILNPHLELLFDGVNLRNYSYDFKMTPRSKDESLMVKRIINLLKRSMAAKTSGAGPQGWFIKNPDVFTLQFMKGRSQHPFLYTHKTCALKNISVNYSDASQDNYASYYDGTPVSLTMTLDFTELSPVYNEDYDNDFADDILSRGVGY